MSETITQNVSSQSDPGKSKANESGQHSIWQVDLFSADGIPDRLAEEVLADAADLGLPSTLRIKAARSFLIQGSLTQAQAEEIANRLLVEPVVEFSVVAKVGSDTLSEIPSDFDQLVNVLPLPGVTDPQAESTLRAIKNLGYPVAIVRTVKRYWISKLDETSLETLTRKLLCNESIESTVVGPLKIDQLDLGRMYVYEKTDVPIRTVDGEQLFEISKKWQLSLSQIEMETIKDHFVTLGRDPSDVELETIAQTWSEHCSHKTLAGRIRYRDENGTIEFDNMLKETIFSATVQIREDLGEDDWCVSVFKDNAGIVKFDDNYNVAFKVETHNRPSALEPYGGANTGIGGVIRDTLGTGMGAKPICNTDVFCFANPETPINELPPGVMHPRRIMRGVVSGVRDYGNRMGIPTVNGAVYFDDRYVGNPLVFCGNVGLLPKEMSFKEPKPNDLIVSIGGRTGRDGIHGATFSSAELTESSDITSGGAVQIGNAITEKMLMDVLLKARDLNLYNAVTDCGAGGYSSAVGEMGEEIGAEVWLEKVPLKYEGLSYTEIWISEAQERMVFAVPEANWEEFEAICAAESVEATVIGRFTPTGNLKLLYKDNAVSDISMEFLHDGRPPVIREAFYEPTSDVALSVSSKTNHDFGANLRSILSSLNVASKHWIIRQYDHEVQGGSVIKPLVGVDNDGPGDAAVVRPLLNSRRGLVISNGMNPHFGDHDPYHMAASSIDEAIRNCVAVGADPKRIAILDNFCWGHTDRPETLGSLVRAALACRDLSIRFQTPFISGKDSLHNEFSYHDENEVRQTISIPSTLLISAMGQVDDVATCVTMDLKSPGNFLYQIGETKDELGGSHWSLVTGSNGGCVPKVEIESAITTFESIHLAIKSGLIRSCHDMSEGGLAAAVAEMAFAGGFGAEVDVRSIPVDGQDKNLARLFAESNSRFIAEVTPDAQEAFEEAMAGVSIGLLGKVTANKFVKITDGDAVLLSEPIEELKSAWQSPLDLD